MEHIGQLLQRGFMGGMVFAAALAGFGGVLYLLCKLIGLTQPKEVRWEERRLMSHRLYQVSWRGRAAYCILCLEETLRFYKQDLAAWEWILRRLWSITDCSEPNWMDVWLDAVGDLLPDEVLTGAGPVSVETGKARDLYTQAGYAMIVIYAILDNMYSMVSEWGPDTASDDPDGIRRIEKAEETMRAFGVPLPSDETVGPLLKQRSFSFGEPFDGFRLSCLSAKR